MTKGLKSVLLVCAFSGLISFVLVELIFFSIFPSAWLFFLIPAIMGFCLKKFAKFPPEELVDDEAFEKLRTRTGVICASLVLITVLISVLPMIVIFGIESLLLSLGFLGGCVVAIYTGYSRGVGVVTDAYYDLHND